MTFRTALVTVHQYERKIPIRVWISLAEIFPCHPADGHSKDLFAQSIFLPDGRTFSATLYLARTSEILSRLRHPGVIPCLLSSRNSGAKILAIDLSLQQSRLSQAQDRVAWDRDMCDTLRRIITSWARWTATFDTIESCRRLHHLRDPLDGWRVLVRLLKQADYENCALQRIGPPLYSSRHDEEIAAQGYTSTDVDIGVSVNTSYTPGRPPWKTSFICRFLISANDAIAFSRSRSTVSHSPDRSGLRASLAFYSVSNCRLRRRTVPTTFSNPHDFYFWISGRAFEQDHPNTFNELSVWCGRYEAPLFF
jgi:hypothetical protein